MRIEKSFPPLAILPSANSVIVITSFLCPFNVLQHFKLFKSHTKIVLSQLQLANPPFDNKIIEVMQLLCPFKV